MGLNVPVARAPLELEHWSSGPVDDYIDAQLWVTDEMRYFRADGVQDATTEVTVSGNGCIIDIEGVRVNNTHNPKFSVVPRKTLDASTGWSHLNVPIDDSGPILTRIELFKVQGHHLWEGELDIVSPLDRLRLSVRVTSITNADKSFQIEIPHTTSHPNAKGETIVGLVVKAGE